MVGSAGQPSRLRFVPVSEPVLAIAGALVVGALILLLTGHQPFEVYRELVQRTLMRRSGLEESLLAMGPVLLAGLAGWIASRVGMWNIGLDGQIVAGAVITGAIAPLLDVGPVWVMWLVATVAGMAGGAAWALLPAVLRTRNGVNEIVTTIMLTYVAFSLASWLVKGPLKDESVVAPATTTIDVARRLPELGGTRIHWGVIVAILLCVAAWGYSRWTSTGILSQVVGDAPAAATRVGVPVDRYVVAGFLLSGAVASMAGVAEVIAVRGSVQADWRPSYALVAFAALFLARRKVLALLPAALLLGMLGYASTVLPRSTGVPPDFFPVLEGLILVFLAIPHWRRQAQGRRTVRPTGATP